jgi:hypothetical protein
VSTKIEAAHPKILEIAEKVTGKRPRTVIDHILKHGYISNEDLLETYGYNHPPRAIRDVREQGVPLDTYKVVDRNGRKIAAYKFSDPSKISQNKIGGRQTFSKAFKNLLLKQYGSKCSFCSEEYEDRYLTIDHRTPYEVVGDGASDERSPGEFILVCGTCQRKKSWSCEQCPNWKNKKDIDVCNSCYWAKPEDYTHMALRQLRRVEIVWEGKEIEAFDKLSDEAKEKSIGLSDLIKQKFV